MNQTRAIRILGVASLVLGLGAIAGVIAGVLAMLLMLIQNGVAGFSDYWQFSLIAGVVGAAVGGVLGPALAFTLLRRVPLGRAALVPGLAAASGVSVAAAFEIRTLWFWILPIATATGAAVVLHLQAERAGGIGPSREGTAAIAASPDGAS